METSEAVVLHGNIIYLVLYILTEVPKGRVFKLGLEIDGSKNLQIASLKFYLIKSCLILLKISEIYDLYLIIKFPKF